MGNTTHLYRWGGSTWALANSVYFWTGSAWQAASRIWRWDATNLWVMVYSTPVPSCASVYGSNSGAADSGFVSSVPAAVSIGGGFSGSATYSWAYSSGDSGIACSSTTTANPTWSKTISDGTDTAFWLLTVTDAITGAFGQVLVEILLTWSNTESPIGVTPYNASGSYTVASGPASATVYTGTGGSAGGCSPYGGSGSYSYSWSYYSGDGGIAINNASLQNPTWSEAMSAAAGTSNSTGATWQVIVTDSQGHTTSTQISITLSITSNQQPLSIGSSSSVFNRAVNSYNPSGHWCTTVNGTAASPPLISPSGGSGTYYYSWTYVSGDATMAIDNASLQTPTWSEYLCSSTGTTTTAVSYWQVAVTDSSGNGPVTTEISVTLECLLEND